MTAEVEKSFARSYLLMRDNPDTQFKRPRGASSPYSPGQICSSYGWPNSIPATPLTIVIGSLGGRFYPNDLAPWATQAGMPVPTVDIYKLPGSNDSPGPADGEVALDWSLAAQAYSYLTGLPAKILIVYGPNSGQAFADVTNYANSLSDIGAGSWSWGLSENNWQQSEINALDLAVRNSTYPWLAASGDNGSNDGTRFPVTDAPACLPSIVGCGGTTFPPNGIEVVWNEGNGQGTGGGFSRIFSKPPWQYTNTQGTGRMVPDLACNADPDTGYNVLINGQWQVIGGTSAVAPLMAGFFAAVNGVRLKNGLKKIGQVNPVLWGMASSFFDCTSGNNGSFSASIGPDPCTGLGRPLGTLFAAMSGNGQVPPPPPPVVVLPPPIMPPPVVTPPPVISPPAQEIMTRIATSVVETMIINGATPPTTTSGAFLQTIIKIIMSLLSTGGLCAITPALAHRRMTRQGPIERLAIKRAVRSNEPNNTLWYPEQQAVSEVGGQMTLEEYTAIMNRN